MYVGDFQLGGIPEWKGYGPDGWNQASIDARWEELHLPPPAPIVPASMIGWSTGAGRDALKLHKKGEKPRWFTQEERDFTNYFGKVAIDPYHKRTGLQNVVGGVLKVASVVVPAFSYIDAAAEAGNAAFEHGRQGGNEALASRAMDSAWTQQAALDQRKEDAAFSDQMKRLQTLAPQAVPLALDTVNAAPLVRETATIKKSSPPPTPLLVAGALMLLGVALS